MNQHPHRTRRHFIADMGMGYRFARLPCDDGIYRSCVFPGLWLDVQALIDGRLARGFEVVQQGVATAEHQDFVKALQQRAQPR
jgi:hypothetical protein